MKKPQLSTTTLTFLAGVAGAGPLPAEAEQLDRHRRSEPIQQAPSGNWGARLRRWLGRSR